MFKFTLVFNAVALVLHYGTYQLILALGLIAWALVFLIEFVGTKRFEVKTALYFLVCFLMIYLSCLNKNIAILFTIAPTIGLVLLPQVLTKVGRQYWSDTAGDFRYFIYTCFGYWDSDGICSMLVQVDEKVKAFNSTTPVPVARGYNVNSDTADGKDGTRAENTTESVHDSLENEDSYYHFSSVISSTIGTRVLLLMIFKFLTPLALYIRYTCPFPIFVYDKKLLAR